MLNQLSSRDESTRQVASRIWRYVHPIHSMLHSSDHGQRDCVGIASVLVPFLALLVGCYIPSLLWLGREDRVDLYVIPLPEIAQRRPDAAPGVAEEVGNAGIQGVGASWRKSGLLLRHFEEPGGAGHGMRRVLGTSIEAFCTGSKSRSMKSTINSNHSIYQYRHLPPTKIIPPPTPYSS